MVATLGHPTYCEWEQVESLASELGVRNRLDDKNKGFANPQFKADCLEQGSAEIDFAIGLRYPWQELQKEVIIKWYAAKLTLAATFTRRLLSLPESFANEIARIRASLLEIKSGTQTLPNCAEMMRFTPGVVNFTVDKRYRDTKIRVQPILSSQDIMPQNTNVHVDADPVSTGNTYPR
jgi:hypothetical protein